VKSLRIGCLSALLGLVFGVILTVGAGLFLSIGAASNPGMPPAPSGQPDVTVVTSAAFLNTQFQAALKQGNLARQGTITFAAPNAARIAMPVDVTLLGQTIAVDATVSLHAIAQNGRIVVAVDKVDVAGVNAAAPLVKQPVERARLLLEDQINFLMQQAVKGTGLVLVNVTAAPDNVTLQFKYGK
jgi:hypothetical protein